MISLRRLGIAGALALSVVAAPSAPVGAATTQVAGTFVFDHDRSTCTGPPDAYADFTDYDPFIVAGDLEGCWYTNVDHDWDLGPPSGLYFELGREVFVGTIRGGRPGTFSTVYAFESQWDPDAATGAEIWGRCQHLIVRGSGTGALRGVTGAIARTDVVADGTATYRGVVRRP